MGNKEPQDKKCTLVKYNQFKAKAIIEKLRFHFQPEIKGK